METSAIGKAGEYRVASELLQRGFNPMIASIDRGIDFILDNGKTIQVKTVFRTDYPGRKNNATIDITTVRYVKGGRIRGHKNLKADFYIIWVMPWSEFFIIPQEVVKNRGQTLSFTKTNSPTANKGLYRFKNCWDLLNK